MKYELYEDGRCKLNAFSLEGLVTWANRKIAEDKEAEKKAKLAKFAKLVDKVVRFKYSHDGKTEVKMVKVEDVVFADGFAYINGFDMMVFDEGNPTGAFRKYRTDRIVGEEVKVF